MDPDPAFVLGPDPDARLRALNEMVAPDNIETVHWLCDRAAPCMVIT